MKRMKFLLNKLFSFENCCLENLLWNVFWMMKSITINVDSNSSFKAGYLHYTFAIICFMSYMYYYQISAIYNTIRITHDSGDVLAISIIISLALSSQISTVKIVAVLALRKHLTSLIDKYRVFDACFEPNSRYAYTILQTLKSVKRRAVIFWCTFCSTSAIYLLTPAFLPGNNLPENNLIAFGLRPIDNSPNYEITYIIIALAGTFATAGIANVTVLLIVLTGYIEAHLRSLTHEMECLWSDVEDEASHSKADNFKVLTNRKINVKLIANIQKHISLLDCHKAVKGLFNEVLALEFLLTTMAMCTMLLGGLEYTYLQIPYTIAQLVVDTIVGQNLINASVALEDAVYRCGWENFDAANMKLLQIMLQCSQKTLKLTAGNVSYLSYICFTSIVRFVYSVYATLRQAVN